LFTLGKMYYSHTYTINGPGPSVLFISAFFCLAASLLFTGQKYEFPLSRLG
jgi:hypothetical protein